MTQQWPTTPPYPDAAPDPGRPTPEDVGTAAQLWWGVAVLGLVQGLAGIAIVLGDRATFVEQLMNEPSVKSGEVEVSEQSVEVLFMVGMGIVVLLMLGVTALFLLFVHLMRKGKNWARTLLTMVGAMIGVSTVPILFGFESGGGATGVVLGGAQILQAVVAVGAIVLMHRKDSNSYFLRLPPAAD